jgi:small GTP-binding protein
MASDVRHKCKVVMIGDSGVGKTALVTRWGSGCFDADIQSTIGARHRRKTVNLDGDLVDIYVWDTAGQEQYRSLTPLYTRMSAAAVLVTSVDNQGSFQSIEMWIDLVRRECDVIPPIILFVNKIDLESPVPDIPKNCPELAPEVFFVSAKTGEGVDLAFDQVVRAAYEFVKRRPTADTILTDTRKSCC